MSADPESTVMTQSLIMHIMSTQIDGSIESNADCRALALPYDDAGAKEET
jgi:hypothetical protein